MLKTIEQHYKKTPYFREYFSIIEQMILSCGKSLLVLNMLIINFFRDIFNINTELVMASKLGCSGNKDDRILSICKSLGATEYLSGTGAKAYHKPDKYINYGVKLTYSEYEPPIYKQQYGIFEKNLSCVDYLFNCGSELPKEWIS